MTSALVGAVVVTLVGALALVPAPSRATTFVTTSLHALAAHADVVVRVRVLARESRWLDEQGPSRIVTFHDVRVLEVLRGTLHEGELSSRRLSVGVPGGVVGDVGQRVHDAPVLEVGREYVLLLGRAGGPGGARGVAGLRHGVVPSGPDLQPLDQAALERALPILRGAALPSGGALPSSGTP